MFRQVSSILLLVVVVVYLLKPITPFIEYSVFKEYIIANLCIDRSKPMSCCEGKCYLKKQVEKNTERESTASTNQKDKKNGGKEVKEFLAVLEYHPLLCRGAFKHITHIANFYSSPDFSGVFIPPRLIMQTKIYWFG